MGVIIMEVKGHEANSPTFRGRQKLGTMDLAT